MSQLPFDSIPASASNAGRVAPLIHKWFARRRPEAIRQVLQGLERPIDKEKLRVLDPFAGSGMILLESALQGHDVYGVDINPVAWLIARQTLNPPEVQEVKRAFHVVDEAVGSQIRGLYGTTTPMGIPAELVTAFYVRVVDAFGRTGLELHHNYLIARNRKKDWAAYYCPNCGAVFTGSCLELITCSECQSTFDWSDGSVFRGQVKIGADRFRLAGLFENESDGPRFKLIAVESYSEETGRLFHKPSMEDFRNLETAFSQCMDNDIAKELSLTSIPTNRRDARPISHGFTYYGQLYTPRQLLSLALIAGAIKDLDEPELKYAMALALSDAAGNNNRMCRYAVDWLKLTPAFGLHGFDVVTRPIEGNVWGAARGRGSFRNCVDKAIRAYTTIRSALEEVEEARKMWPIRDVRCMPAQELSSVPWEPMDAVITDPPYFDNLDYAELGDFYFQWLRIVMGHEPPFDREHSIDESDLAAIASVGQDPVRFSEELSQVFQEAMANLTPTGVVTFSYHHGKSIAWECLAESLKLASIAPYKVTFVRSELENGFHSSNGNIKTDAIFYCKSRAVLEGVVGHRLIADALVSLSALEAVETIKPVDFTNAGYALAAALTALDPTEDFAEMLSVVRRVAEWD